MEKIRIAPTLLFTLCLGGCAIPGGEKRMSCVEECMTALDPEACMPRCNVCQGDCVTRVPEGFDGPVLLWIGWTHDTPQCPESAPTTVFRGHDTPDSWFGCEPCRCGAPSCVLPEGVKVASTTRCDGERVMLDVPNTRALLSGACVMPGELLVSDRKSILLGAPTVSPCEAMVEPPPVPLQLNAPWIHTGIACGGVIREDTCIDEAKTCVPADPKEIFAQCIMHLGDGDVACPRAYPEKAVLYGDMVDDRSCTPCECGPPTGSECTLALLSFRDPACTDLLTADVSSPKGPSCGAPAPTVPPKSMKATWLVNEPGSCEPSGGEPTGKVTPINPSTFCCDTRPDKNRLR